ncbi:hypothetical protein D3C86_1823340 [compost metagenome]
MSSGVVTKSHATGCASPATGALAGRTPLARSHSSFAHSTPSVLDAWHTSVGHAWGATGALARMAATVRRVTSAFMRSHTCSAVVSPGSAYCCQLSATGARSLDSRAMMSLSLYRRSALCGPVDQWLA